ncbi:methyltransferase family protein [Sphaerotilus mobilis]|uniref:Methyltransferase family protein n=2 Tax=Sphaerotilus mobilis TaxID=47994 RepID=A0A4Q7LBW4_9BURK|nr:methyltransferase family protein [Sphaerotilus mobilis]
MRIIWVIEGLQDDGQGGHTSPLASYRYRVILPAEGLRDLGHEVRFVELDAWLATDRPGDADIVVIGKFLPGRDLARYQQRGTQLLDQARVAAGQGARVVADFNDDHFDHPQMGTYWRGLADVAQVRVVGSEAMKARLLAVCGGVAQVVGDPLGSPHDRPRVRHLAVPGGSALTRWWRGSEAAGERLQLLWFGHPVNWPAMANWLPALVGQAAEVPMSLEVVTQPLPQIVEALTAVTRRSEGRLQARCLAWDEATQWAALERCDIVLIPSDPDDPRKAVKTANRLTDALHAGRWVVASPLPAYRPWAAHVSLVDDPIDGLRHWRSHPDDVEAALVAGQRVVEERCSVPAVAQAWLEAFQTDPAASLASREVLELAVYRDEGRIRLNLGCGAKIWPGFVNVDLDQNWSGLSPDVIADVTGPLPFPDGHADEVHAYHVLEHLPRWAVEDCLREWQRVLKPGGALVLEMPCLDKILAIFQHHIAQGTPAPMQLTLFGLFGDPGYRNEAMLHRWCYSKHELRKLLERVGLVSIVDELPRTHRPERDVRMIGRRPEN